VLGRRRPLLAGSVLYVVASLACSLAPSLPLLAAGRLAQGFAASSGVVISRAIVRDLYSGVAAARAFSRMFLVLGMAPMVAPIVGSQILKVTSWRGIFVTLVGLGLVLLAAGSTRLPETLPPERRRPATVRATASTFRLLLSSGRFVGYALPIACTVGMFVACLASVPFVVQDVYGRSPQAFAAIFFAISLVMMAISQLNARLVATIDPRRLLAVGSAAQLTGALAVLAFGTRGFWAFFACLGIALPWWGFVVANATALAMRDYAAVAGTAAALIGVAQYGFSAFAAPLTGLAGHGSIRALGVLLTVLAAVSCSIVAVTVTADRRRERAVP
jgi:DHA1 family bicyclomycin/chloramphenicol resistance-like MFS transporter